jgi:cholesterol oxidase
MTDQNSYDYDWIVIGSGFGGSVAALRLAEKGYKVGVLECGRRYEDDTLPKTFWHAWKVLWMPWLKAFGLIRVSLFKHVAVLSGSSVGGGSHAYAGTLYRAKDVFYQHKQWKDLANWQEELAPHYETAEHMLGAVRIPFDQPIDALIKDAASELGCGQTYQKANAGIFFGDSEMAQGTKVADPYFGGKGPDRTVCIRCGACMLGCQFGAKNTTKKNYLWFAENLGVKIHALTSVVNITALGAEDGSAGYEIETVKTGTWLRKSRQKMKTRGVVLAAGAIGTNRLLGKLKVSNALPRLSARVNKLVRTNSETLLALQMPANDIDYSQGVVIPASIFPEEGCHIEFATAGRWGSAFGLLNTVLPPAIGSGPQPFRFLVTVVRHPIWFLKALWPVGNNKRQIVFGWMQTMDEAISFRVKRRWLGGWKMDTELDPGVSFPNVFPKANAAVRKIAAKHGAIPLATVFEAIMGKPVTAHLMGGAVVGENDQTGVVDARQRVFNYENFLICDGSAMPANPGANPSLTITAMAERAMSFVPANGQTGGNRF